MIYFIFLIICISLVIWISQCFTGGHEAYGAFSLNAAVYGPRHSLSTDKCYCNELRDGTILDKRQLTENSKCGSCNINS